MARSFEVPALRPASSVRSDEVRLGVGSRHRELGGADIDGPDYAGTGKETGTDPRQRTAEKASPRSRDAPRSRVPGRRVERGQRRRLRRSFAPTRRCHRDCTCRVTIPPRPADSPRFSDLDLESDRLPVSVQPGLGDPFSCRVQGLEARRLAGARYGTRPSRCTGRRSRSDPGHIHNRAGRSRPGTGNLE